MSETREIARRVEQASAFGTARAVRDLGTWAEDPRYGSEPLQDGCLILTPPDVPLWGVKGVGFEAPVSDDTIEHAEALCAAQGVPTRFDASPLADPTLAERLDARGYARSCSCEVWIREPAPFESGPLPPGVEVHAVDATDDDDVRRFAHTVASGYCEGGTPDAWNEMIGRNAARRPTRQAFLATVDGAVAGGGLVSMNDGLASFTFMSTLPSYRRRGVQGALMRARLTTALEHGADLINVQCEPGSPTARNAERLGFRLLYTRDYLTREV